MAENGIGVGHVVKAWGRILAGRHPNLSIEITKECPLTCPGCYAYGDEHLGGDITLRGLSDFKGTTRSTSPSSAASRSSASVS